MATVMSAENIGDIDTTSVCFHCGLPIPPGITSTVNINGNQQPMCCKGCEAVASAIINNGMSDFYKYRTETNLTGRELVPDVLGQSVYYDNPKVQKSFVRKESEHIREASLILEGITCAACIWLNEHHISSLDGVLDAQINYSTHRARVRWDESKLHLSEILQAIRQIGYAAHPYDPDRQQNLLETERKQLLRRLGLAGVLGMQVMMIAIALYVGDWSGIEQQFRSFFYWLSFGLTLPVVLYSAKPFFSGAWRSLKQFSTGMDVPVSSGIAIAFSASAWHTITGTGDVYYDSVVMFVFLLLTARYIEMSVRQRSADSSDALVHLTPAVATRLSETESGYVEEVVAVAELSPGDRLLIRPGETIPTDGRIIDGRSTVDESLLTGESLPVSKTVDQSVIGGSINVESPLTIEVEKLGQDTVMAAIQRLLERAQSEKPTLARLADRVASWFVSLVLFMATIVGLYWWQTDPERWLPILISVLVITCPCALSLATPAAMTAATGKLMRLGLLVTRGHALETLARATHFVFDKTGTLTSRNLNLVNVHTFSDLSEQECLAYAGALETGSEHPIAQAIVNAATGARLVVAQTVTNTPGAGLEGNINGSPWFIGTPQFILNKARHSLTAERLTDLQQAGHTVVLLASRQRIHAGFVLGYEIRDGARTLVNQLQQAGKTVMLWTGDHEQAARAVADELGIEQCEWDMLPANKLEKMKALQQQGAVVAMIGDGVNDAPVLAAAQVSIAMGSGTQVAMMAADILLLGDQLSHLASGVQMAEKTLRIIRQNMMWALGYNLIALPFAAIGYVKPWMAAIGMSTSSLLVVANAMRLNRGHDRE